MSTSFNHQGYRIEYCRISKRWYVLDWDYETDYHQIGPSHPTKIKAIQWCEN